MRMKILFTRNFLKIYAYGSTHIINKGKNNDDNKTIIGTQKKYYAII